MVSSGGEEGGLEPDEFVFEQFGVEETVETGDRPLGGAAGRWPQDHPNHRRGGRGSNARGIGKKTMWRWGRLRGTRLRWQGFVRHLRRGSDEQERTTKRRTKMKNKPRKKRNFRKTITKRLRTEQIRERGKDGREG